MNLGPEATRAARFLVGTNLTDQIRLQEIVIRRLSTVRKAMGRPIEEPGDLTNKWFIAFAFLNTNQPAAPYKSVVTLLDGSYGVEQLVTPKEGSMSINTITRDEAEPPAEPSAEGENRVARINPLAEVQDTPGFRVPLVQWDALAQSFPIDLHSHALAAETYITNRVVVPQKSLRLIEIRLYPVFPMAAVLANHLNGTAHLHHWLLLFRFRQDPDLANRDYCAYMLLDGTVLDFAVEKIPPLTDSIFYP